MCTQLCSRLSTKMFKRLSRFALVCTTAPLKNGRWAREHEMRKIDLANYDNCGGGSHAKLTKMPPPSDNYDNSMELAALQSFHVHPSK